MINWIYRTPRARTGFLFVATLCTPSAYADEPTSARKQAFTLFDPTPKHLMREMSTDRPDTTESPFTVDAGHFQVELSLFDYAYDDHEGGSAETFAILPTNLK